jgi:hypothetical protein
MRARRLSSKLGVVTWRGNIHVYMYSIVCVLHSTFV